MEQDFSTVSINSLTEMQLLENKIAAGIKDFESRKVDLTALKERVEGLDITDIADKAALKTLSDGRKEVKSARVAIEKEAKSMRDPLTEKNRFISKKEKELIDIIEPTEKKLLEKEDWVKAEEEKIRQAEVQKKQERLQTRVDRLAEYGFELDLTLLAGIDDEQFEKTVESARGKWQIEQDALAEKECQEQEARDQSEKDRLELKALREKQEEADRILKERQNELDRQAKQLKDKQDQATEKEHKRLQAEADARIEHRINQMTGFGLTFDFSDRHYKGFDCFVPILDIQCHSAEEWDKLIAEITPAIERTKKKEAQKAEEKRLQDIEDAKQEAIAEEKERQRQAVLKAQLEKQAEADLKQKRLEESGDKAIWTDFISRLSGIKVPTVKSGQYRKMAVIARDKLEEIQKLKP
jgi:hypothetical protein